MYQDASHVRVRYLSISIEGSIDAAMKFSRQNNPACAREQTMEKKSREKTSSVSVHHGCAAGAFGTATAGLRANLPIHAKGTCSTGAVAAQKRSCSGSSGYVHRLAAT